MKITFTFFNKNYTITPYRVSSNALYDAGTIALDYYGGGIGASYFSNIEENGTTIDLKTIFLTRFYQLRNAGVDYEDQVGIKFCDIVQKFNDADYDCSLYYRLKYVAANSNELIIYISGGLVNGVNGLARGEYYIIMDYAGVTGANKYTKLCCIEKATYNQYEATWNGVDMTNASVLMIGTPAVISQPVLSLDTQASTQVTPQYILYHNIRPIEEHETLLPPDDYENPLTNRPNQYARRYWTCSFSGQGAIGDNVTTQQASPDFGMAAVSDRMGQVLINGVEYEFATEEDPDGGQTDYTDYSPYSGPYADSSDYVPMDGVPQNDALQTGFIKAYSLTPAISQQLANYMLSDDFVDNVKKLMANPIDYVLSFVMLPISPVLGSSEHIKMGGVDTEISAFKVAKQFITFNCGSVNCKEFWGGFQDYAPNSKVSCYIPMVGVQPLNIDDVMDGEITLTYRIDVLTGEFIASLHCDTSRKINGETYFYSGSMGMDIPITGTSYQSKVNSFFNGISGIVSVASGNYGAIPSMVQNITDVALSKPDIQRSGSIAGSAGVLGNYTPFLIIERPVQAIPKTYKHLNGYPSRIGGKLGTFSGYTEIEQIDMTGVSATDEEKNRAIAKLKEGVFI